MPLDLMYHGGGETCPELLSLGAAAVREDCQECGQQDLESLSVPSPL